MKDEVITCDLCKQRIVKDCGIPAGMAMEVTFYEPGRYEFSVTKRHYDFCRSCRAAILAVMDAQQGSAF